MGVQRPSQSPLVIAVGGSGTGMLFRVARIPSAGETALAETMQLVNGGKASNQAIGAARLGCRSAIVTALGSDIFAQRSRDLWTCHGVDTSQVVGVPDADTMVGALFVEESGENRIIVALGALERLRPKHASDAEEIIAQAAVCLVSLEVPADFARAALMLARRHNVTTILNPAPAPAAEDVERLLPLADYVTPNATEAAAMAGGNWSPENTAARLQNLGASAVIITLGPEGGLLKDAQHCRRFPAPPVAEVVDTAGAGDAFNAAFACGLARGLTPLAACELGADAGSRIVQGPGFVEALPQWEGLTIAACAADRI